MHPHRPSCLQGPFSGDREWWQQLNLATTPGQDELPFRADLVARLRREIADGTYPTAEHWEAALEQMLRRLEGREE
jgi:hypothetical protein